MRFDFEDTPASGQPTDSYLTMFNAATARGLPALQGEPAAPLADIRMRYLALNVPGKQGDLASVPVARVRVCRELSRMNA
jgi:hypothetical protein